MVPRQPFNELKPKSGQCAWNSLEFTKKKILREMPRDARRNCVRKPATSEKIMAALRPFRRQADAREIA
jgi:hypothetical protein